jgi:putative hydrolase of the HAD superfamily
MLKAVLFDLDNTLQDLDTAFQQGLLLAAGPLCRRLAVTVEGLADALKRTWPPLWQEFMAGTRAESALYPEWFRRALGDLGLSLSRAARQDLVRRYTASFERHLALFPDVVPTLSQLAGWRPPPQLAILTNGPGACQRQRIHALGLDAYIKTYVISEEVGVGKPETAFFHHAPRQLDVVPQETVMIGDTYDADIQGALRVGIRAVWLNRLDVAGPDKDVAVPVVQNLAQALPLLTDWGLR